MLENANNIKLHVVLVDGLGELHKYSHFLHPDADIQSFHEELDQRFPKYCDPHDEWAYKNWDERVQDLKKTGLDGNPALHRIEGLVILHRAMADEELPQWMYYTILEGGDSERIDIQDEESLRTMMDKAAKQESPACLMRVSPDVAPPLHIEAEKRAGFSNLKFYRSGRLNSEISLLS